MNFGVLGSLQLWGWRVGVWEWGWFLQGVPTHMHTHTHAHMCTHAHIHVKHDNFNCKWQPPLGESLGIPYDVIRMCTCVCMCACMCVCMCVGAPSHHPHPIHPPPTPQGGTPGISQNSIGLELIEIFQFCLKI